MKDTAAGGCLLGVLGALANPHRLRILAALQAQGRTYVSQLARDVGLSRPLTHLHLKKLEQADLISSRLELSADGKALNFFEIRDFAFNLTPTTVADAAATLHFDPSEPRRDTA